jgi:hypothetical protein
MPGRYDATGKRSGAAKAFQNADTGQLSFQALFTTDFPGGTFPTVAAISAGCQIKDARLLIQDTLVDRVLEMLRDFRVQRNSWLEP